MMYPLKFYVAHKLFSGPPFKTPVWGDILDGPTEHASAVVEAVLDTFRDEQPTRATLRVWFLDGIRYHDMTDSVLRAYYERVERVA